MRHGRGKNLFLVVGFGINPSLDNAVDIAYAKRKFTADRDRGSFPVYAVPATQ